MAEEVRKVYTVREIGFSGEKSIVGSILWILMGARTRVCLCVHFALIYVFLSTEERIIELYKYVKKIYMYDHNTTDWKKNITSTYH